MASEAVSQHKRMAMNKSTGHVSRVSSFAKGGSTGNLKTGIKENPITVSKMNNGVPGMKKGGKTKDGC
jgi:hypothetical protein